ncbi:hypothetical protein DV711_10920 [Motiliproteus coralliicola]|uniref:Uncharacterized protein n=1 Tax=Motiliproteus coralliicola TaxID=2283196 RepID=A0A369WCF2_9GAMM|nr:hypothetical protein [Motiliproteus coralliicola]RDE19402.1 hypothetical protein DV711_10920 [Motiliproteus coralliicola]
MAIDSRITQAVLAALPLLLSPLLLFALAEGWLDFGGGEKDVLLVLPYLILTFTFFCCSLVLILKRWPLSRWVKRSAALSFGLLLLLWIVAYVTSWLGVS